jgi:hypothetical protein
MAKIQESRTPSPVHYKPNDAGASTNRKAQAYKISKCPKKNFLDQIIAESRKLPGAGYYNTEQSYNRVTIGLRKSYK